MKWYTINNKVRPLSPKKYLIDWSGPSLSQFQFKVKSFFKEYWQDDIVGEEVTLPNTALRVDIINFTKKIAIECNGGFHTKYSPYFHGNFKKYQDQISRDVEKEFLLEKNGFMVIEIYEKNMPLTEKWILETFGDILY